MSITAESVLDQLEAATKAAITLARELAASRRDGDEWLRLPAVKGRCPLTNWSRSTINRLIADDKVRSKSVNGGRFYAGADVRRLINK